MSIRFHKGPSIITLFHDSSSATSKQVLQLLTSYNNPHRPSTAAVASGLASGSGSHGESCIIEANGSGSDPTHTSNATSYLRNLASDPPTPPAIQLEIVDRKANPPTPDQLRSIVDYLATTTTTDTTDSTSSSSHDRKKSSKHTTSIFDLSQHEKRKRNLAQHLKSDSGQGGMPKIKDGPLVVNWDEGTAATSLEGVKQMLMRLERSNNANQARGEGDKDAGGCIVC
ncbi:uncharacterized protein UTRI_03474 [Ustilago trichophora]|uniref:Uncharacterized protein n=1 Tax=Ustilago trichophora TaxID=86804 RepID=A0A5C3E3U1_9BASI|nr:uncharacterized protein UTRI_03474 [Ustilago trichophora]